MERGFEKAQKGEETPFREPLEKTGYSFSIKSLENQPNKLVRKRVLDERNLEKSIDEFKRGFKVFDVLEKYGIAVPKRDSFISKLIFRID